MQPSFHLDLTKTPPPQPAHVEQELDGHKDRVVEVDLEISKIEDMKEPPINHPFFGGHSVEKDYEIKTSTILIVRSIKRLFAETRRGCLSKLSKT